MASEKQIAANRRNARKSTGPRTSEGKANSSRNAAKHGVLSEHVVSNDEDHPKFQALLLQLASEYEPCTAMESALVERLAILLWRERRLARAEMLRLNKSEADSHGFGGSFVIPTLSLKEQLLVGRYQTMLTNQINQTLRQLRAEKDLRLTTIEAEPGHREE